MRLSGFFRVVLSAALLVGCMSAWPHPARAGPCNLAATATLYGAEDVATIAGEGSSGCSKQNVVPIASQQPQPYFTFEVACSADRQAAAEGLCSTTPCSASGRFFAFRTVHRPDGSSGPAGFSCVSLEEAVATPGVTLAQVFAAVQRVKLPGGEIGVEPEVRGLANLESYFGWRGRNRLRLICRWVGRRCMRSFGWWSTGGA